jgi:hypothetical protein
MANDISLPAGYENVLLEAYRKESLTSVLENTAPGGNIAQMEQLGTFYYPEYSTGGLGDVQANGKLPANSGVSLKWKPVNGNYDRGTILEVDEKTDAESFNIAFGQAANHLNRFKVVPEGDAFVFSAICASAGITSASKTFSDGAGMLAELNAQSTAMDEAEVPEEGRILFITPTLLGSVRDLDTTKSREALAQFSTIQKVPQSRFYSAIDMLDGVSADEQIGHYKKAAAAKDLNFMIVHKDAMILRWKFQAGNVISPQDNQTGFGYLYKYRKYGVCGVRENLGHYIAASYKAS